MQLEADQQQGPFFAGGGQIFGVAGYISAHSFPATVAEFVYKHDAPTHLPSEFGHSAVEPVGLQQYHVLGLAAADVSPTELVADSGELEEGVHDGVGVGVADTVGAAFETQAIRFYFSHIIILPFVCYTLIQKIKKSLTTQCCDYDRAKVHFDFRRIT